MQRIEIHFMFNHFDGRRWYSSSLIRKVFQSAYITLAFQSLVISWSIRMPSFRVEWNHFKRDSMITIKWYPRSSTGDVTDWVLYEMTWVVSIKERSIESFRSKMKAFGVVKLLLLKRIRPQWNQWYTDGTIFENLMLALFAFEPCENTIRWSSQPCGHGVRSISIRSMHLFGRIEKLR